MTNQKIGATTWESKPRKRFEDDDLRKFSFMKLRNGKNVCRIITAPYRYLFVRVNGPKATSKFGDRVNVAAPDVCPAQKAGLQPKERYYAGVFDLTDREVKILDMSVLIHEQMSGILKDLEDDKGRKFEPSEFSVNIQYNKGAAPANTYGVVRRDVEPLSEEDQAIVDEALPDLIKILEIKSSYFKPETVQRRMEAVGWTPEFQAEADANAKKEKETEKGDAKLETSDDEDYSFDKPVEAAAN